MAGPSVLVVDDDAVIAELVATAFRELGYDVTTVGSGAEALRQLARTEPDLVVTDWQMAGLNGDHVVSAARELQPGVPIVVITGRPDQAAALIDPNDPRVVLLPKPFELGALQALGRRLVAA
jgi:two-component system OmpR family response regulator